jgi:hypothetical protein
VTGSRYCGTNELGFPRKPIVLMQGEWIDHRQADRVWELFVA